MASLVEVAFAMVGNPFVDYLNRYTTFSPEHEAAFDEFVMQMPSPSGEPLRLETKTEQFVRKHIRQKFPPSIILTGNADDGKTYLCRQIIEDFIGQSITDWSDQVDWCQVPDCIDTTRGQLKGSSPKQSVQQIAEEKDCPTPHEDGVDCKN